MHECPECGQACDCDGEDTWNDIGSSDWANCTHECEDFEEDDLMPDMDELDKDGNMVDPWGDDQGRDDDMLFCTKHLCPKNLVDYEDGSRYECPVCSREDGEALGRV